jgi:hypothetical protein
MQVIHEPGLEFVHVDEQKIAHILLEQEVDESVIDNLKIFIQTYPSEEEARSFRQRDGANACGGYAIADCDEIHVFTHKYYYVRMNNTLLHEMHHIIKYGYRPGERNLPHDERPSEIAACLFAEQQEKLHDLISVPALVRCTSWMARPMSLSNGVFAASLGVDIFVIIGLGIVIIDTITRHVK